MEDAEEAALDSAALEVVFFAVVLRVAGFLAADFSSLDSAVAAEASVAAVAVSGARLQRLPS